MLNANYYFKIIFFIFELYLSKIHSVFKLSVIFYPIFKTDKSVNRCYGNTRLQKFLVYLKYYVRTPQDLLELL